MEPHYVYGTPEEVKAKLAVSYYDLLDVVEAYSGRSNGHTLTDDRYKGFTFREVAETLKTRFRDSLENYVYTLIVQREHDKSLTR